MRPVLHFNNLLNIAKLSACLLDVVTTGVQRMNTNIILPKYKYEIANEYSGHGKIICIIAYIQHSLAEEH